MTITINISSMVQGCLIMITMNAFGNNHDNDMCSPSSGGGLPATERLLFSTSKPRILEMTLLMADYMNMMGANLPKVATRSTIHSRSVSRTRLQVIVINFPVYWMFSSTLLKMGQTWKFKNQILNTKYQNTWSAGCGSDKRFHAKHTKTGWQGGKH